MQFIRRTSLGLCASLLFTFLFAFGLAFSVQRVFGTPTAIKHAIKESGLYSSAVGDALNNAQKEQEKQGQSTEGEGIPVNNPEIRTVIEHAASPEFLQTQTEQVLDGVYAWMQGKTAKLSFNVDLTDVKARLADGLAQYVGQRLGTLPACASNVPASADFDPFNAACVPKGINIAEVSAKAKDQILNGEFLKDSTQLNADTIKTGNGKTLDQQLKAVPTIYQRSNQGVYILGALALLLAVAVIFLSITRRSGFRKVAITFIAIGTFSALIAWLSSFAVKRLSEQLATTSGGVEPLQQKLFAVAQLLINDVRGWWMGYGIALIVVGVVTLVVLTIMDPKTKSPKVDEPAAEEPKKSAEPAAEEAPKPVEQKPAPTPKPRPSKKLVQ